MIESSRCALCACSRMSEWIDGIQDRLGCAPGIWRYRRCRNCGTATLAPVPTPDQLASWYPEHYTFTRNSSDHSGGVRRLLARCEWSLFYRGYYAAQANAVGRLFRRRSRPVRVLDVGCGSGHLLRALAQAGFDAEGVDFHLPTVERTRVELGVPVTCGDARDLASNFPPKSFDVVTAFHVLEHLPDVSRFLRDCVTLVRPGGWLVGAVPLGESIQASLFGARWMAAAEAPRHLSLPSRRGIRLALRTAGFQKVVIRPDSLWSCASVLGLTLFPGSTTAKVYPRVSRSGVAMRILGALATAAVVPWCFVEANVFGRPAAICFAARTPPDE